MKKLLARLLRLLASQPLLSQRELDCLCRPHIHVQFLSDRRIEAQRPRTAG